MSPSLSSTLWSCHAAKRHLLHSFVFVICFVCGCRAGILVLTFLVVNMLHSGIAVRPCCTTLLSFGRPCLTCNRGTIAACTGCAHGLRSCWRSTQRSLQRFFVVQVHLVSGWLSPCLQSPGASAKRSVDATDLKTTKLFVKMAYAACLSCVGGVDLVRFCRCLFHADRPRTARDHMSARQKEEFMVGVVIHVTGWSAWCATIRWKMAQGS